MKALLLIEDDDTALEVERRLKPLGFETVRYRNPLKALDNLEEIAPDAIIASALDFPRHWKIIAEVVRAAKSRHQCLIILLRGEHFDAEEAHKASHLGVNGVISERLSDPAEQAKLLRLLRRYLTISDAREDERLPAAPWDRIRFLFSHPTSTRILAGHVTTISSSGISLGVPEGRSFEGIEKGSILEDCSLGLGDGILAIRCKVARKSDDLGLVFLDLGEKERLQIEQFLAGSIHREISARSHGDVDKS